MHSSESHNTAVRGSGVLLHISSLPSPLGCGDLGARAREFATRLGAAGQRLWQVLPLNPTTAGAGESPYFSNSAQAGNPLLISLEDLAGDGLLSAAELPGATPPAGSAADFRRARQLKSPLLDRAARRHLQRGLDPDYDEFCRRESHWLADHALFTALRGDSPRPWIEWPEEIRFRDASALDSARERLADEIAVESRLQYFFARQWQRLRAHCHGNGVALFGDIPIYVSYDSADVWANPSIFQLDAALHPLAESGVPPDYFSATGQLWRNPVYDWERLQDTGFEWWVRRLQTQLARFDLLRIDHFRGLAQYWEVPAGSETAIHGQWKDVPSHAFFDTLRARIDPLPVVAEDLGTITPDVHALRDHYGFPGMIVLHFAFGDDHYDNPYKPQNHRENAVAYLGTHDNTTTRAWLEELDAASRQRLAPHLPCLASGAIEEQVRGMIELLLSSVARSAIVCAQDLLALPGEARMNTPGLEVGNWHWQLSEGQFEALPLEWLAQRCAVHGR